MSNEIENKYTPALGDEVTLNFQKHKFNSTVESLDANGAAKLRSIQGYYAPAYLTLRRVPTDYFEDGDACPEAECNGRMGFNDVVGCSCHLTAPCVQCVDNPLVCLECGFDPYDLEVV